MSLKRDDILIRLEPDWKLLGDALIKSLNLSRNQVITDLYKGWILKRLSEITNTDYADSPQGLQDAAEALLKYRDDERVKDASADAELLQYLNRCKEIQSERQAAELIRLNQQEEERKHEEHIKKARKIYYESSEKLVPILLSVIPADSCQYFWDKWSSFVRDTRPALPKDEQSEQHEQLTDEILSFVSGSLSNESLSSESEESQNLKKEALAILSELRSYSISEKDIQSLLVDSFLNSKHYLKPSSDEDE